MNLPEEMQKVLNLLSKPGVKYELIADCRCFVVPREWFLMIYDFGKQNDLMDHPSVSLTKEGYDNFQLFAATIADQNSYFVCTEAQPILSTIWKDHYKEPSK